MPAGGSPALQRDSCWGDRGVRGTPAPFQLFRALHHSSPASNSHCRERMEQQDPSCHPSVPPLSHLVASPSTLSFPPSPSGALLASLSGSCGTTIPVSMLPGAWRGMVAPGLTTTASLFSANRVADGFLPCPLAACPDLWLPAPPNVTAGSIPARTAWDGKRPPNPPVTSQTRGGRHKERLGESLMQSLYYRQSYKEQRATARRERSSFRRKSLCEGRWD